MKQNKKIHGMDIILAIVAITLFVFTSIMILLYVNTGGIPDTLCTCVFGVLGTECGAMAWIKTAKEKAKNGKDDYQ